MNTLGGRVASFLIGLATAIVIVAVAIVPFLTPQFGRLRAGSRAGDGVDRLHDRRAPDGYATRSWPTSCSAATSTSRSNGKPVLEAREQAHMNDVRTVFRGLWVLALISVVVLAVASRRRGSGSTWRAVRRGALGLTVGVVVVGVVGLVAFDQLFEVFHEVFFPAGSYTFDPATDQLVQLFPFAFWDETALVVGAVIIALALVVAVVAGRRGRGAIALREPASDLAAVPEPGS